MCDQYGHPDWTAAEFLLAIRDVAGTLDEIAAENDRLRQAMREIAYAPFGHAEATHAEVLNDITEHARKALNG